MTGENGNENEVLDWEWVGMGINGNRNNKSIGISKGCSGCTYTPRVDKNFLGIIHRENL